MTTQAPAYAIAYLREVDFNDQIVDYLERIDVTLDEFGGHFIVHGGELTPVEGEWDGSIVVIEFPSRQAALDWYASPGYQAILRLRTDNTQSIATLVDGVPAGYRATHGLAAMLATR